MKTSHGGVCRECKDIRTLSPERQSQNAITQNLGEYSHSYLPDGLPVDLIEKMFFDTGKLTV